jgi:hypothetical protein
MVTLRARAAPASRLKFSRFAEVTLVENERVETILRCLARDFVAFGGLPLMGVRSPKNDCEEARRRSRGGGVR